MFANIMHMLYTQPDSEQANKRRALSNYFPISAQAPKAQSTSAPQSNRPTETKLLLPLECRAC